MTDLTRAERVVGALVGSVVGDALGAPFEFGGPSEFSRRFPVTGGGENEMCGGRGWRGGEWTDDTQMALLLAGSLLDCGGLDEANLFGRFGRWLRAGPADVGNQTRAVLGSGLPWDRAAEAHFARTGHAAGNGSIMRTVPAAIYFAHRDRTTNDDAARRISGLTHGDPAAGDGCVIYHRLVAAALGAADPLDELPTAIDAVPADRRAKWQTVLAPGWTPADATEPNGAVWPTLGTAVWALRRGWSFEDAMGHVIDIGGDTDTIACVAGGLLGAVQGIGAIPPRWAQALNGEIPGNPAIATDLASLRNVALRLDAADSAR